MTERRKARSQGRHLAAGERRIQACNFDLEPLRRQLLPAMDEMDGGAEQGLQVLRPTPLRISTLNSDSPKFFWPRLGNLSARFTRK